MLYTVTTGDQQKIFRDVDSLLNHLMEEFAKTVRKRLKEKMCGEDNVKNISHYATVALHREVSDGPRATVIPNAVVKVGANGHEYLEEVD